MRQGRAWRGLGRALLVLGPLALGLAILVRAAGDRPGPVLLEPAELATAARVLTLEPAPFVPEVAVMGAIEPVRSWQAVAEVAGRVETVLPGLRPGRLVDQGTVLVRLDATDLALAAAQAAARLDAAEARLAELAAREASLAASRGIEERVLAVAEAERDRRLALLARGATTQAALDQAEEAVLQRRARLQEIANEERLLPAQRRVQEAERAVAEAQLAQARRDLERAVVTMPFDGRIAEVAVERDEYVARGRVMLVAEDLGEAETTAWLRLEEARALFAEHLPAPALLELDAGAIDALPRAAGLEAELRLHIDGLDVRWPAELRRLTFALDPGSRTLGIVVAARDPFGQAVPGRRPPLVKGLFVEIVLRGPPLPEALVLPRTALERQPGGAWQAMRVDADDRLQRVPVEIAWRLGDVAVVAAGLAPGDRVVVSALPFAIDGMLLDPLPAD